MDGEKPDPTPGAWPLRLTQDLMCLVCRELLCKPVSLWCGHSFCQDCLNKWMLSSSQSCPSCRQKIPTGKCIQVNQAISAFLSHMNGTTEKEPRRHEPSEDEKVVKDGISQQRKNSDRPGERIHEKDIISIDEDEKVVKDGISQQRKNSDGPGERIHEKDIISIDEDEKDEFSVESDAVCAICKETGEMIVCEAGDHKLGCGNVYHLHCIDLNVCPKGKSMAEFKKHVLHSNYY